MTKTVYGNNDCVTEIACIENWQAELVVFYGASAGWECHRFRSYLHSGNPESRCVGSSENACCQWGFIYWSRAYYTVTPQKWLHRRSVAEPPNFRSMPIREYLRDFHDFLWDELAKSKAFSYRAWFVKYSSIFIFALLREFTWLTIAHV